MDDQARVLVLGRGGWLGSAVWGLLSMRRAIAHGPRSDELDTRNPTHVNEALETFQPTAVLNLVAARPSAGENDLQGLNVHAAGLVAAECARRGTRLIHVSTDALLDGYDAPYADDAPATPLTPYGRSKAAGEVFLGTITLDGHDIRDLTIQSVRQQISIVLQDVFLFHGTAGENIMFGRQGATEEEMIAAAKVANAHTFITKLPDGYDTLIGERGVKLSGGQKQRMAIARAVLKDAPILILDEATSSVDTETEQLIQRSLEQLMIGKTVLVIAHRLSTIRNADLIVVLDGSQIIESGTHEELISNDGLYKRLNDAQVAFEPRWRNVSAIAG